MNGAGNIEVTFLSDGGQTAETVASELTAFFDAATRSLDIAIYDCGLTGDVAQAVAASLKGASSRGVAVRLAYFSDSHDRAPGVPPPHGSSPDFAQSLRLSVKPISGYHALMHHKYVIRDAGTPQAAVWTGSTNWTVDAFGREENIIVRLPSQALSGAYQADFEQMWATGVMLNTGRAGGEDTLMYEGYTAPTDVWFSPGQGVDMAHAVATEIAHARQRIVIASPVLTVGTILGALADVVHAGSVHISGVYDWTQMQEVQQQWGAEPQAAWKIHAFRTIAQASHLAGKHSTPFAPGSVHDYMHMKAIVVDDAVFTGSYNFSHSGEENAENLLRIDSGDLASACADFIGTLCARYGDASANP